MNYVYIVAAGDMPTWLNPEKVESVWGLTITMNSGDKIYAERTAYTDQNALLKALEIEDDK